MNKKGFLNIVLYFAMILFVGAASFCLYVLYKNEIFLKDEIAKTTVFSENLKNTIQAQSSEIQRLQFVPTEKISWIDVQKDIKDSIVQLFVTVAKFNWLEPWKSPEQGAATGSGFFINNNCHFITNFHVISEASSINVQVPSQGQEYFEAELIGVNPERDVALLKLKDEDCFKLQERLGKIPYLNLGDSDRILRGQEILALGYPLGTQTLKSTQGIVSGRERFAGHPYGYIQITAPLNPGNSGGPAINTSKEVIGINTAGVIMAQNVGYIIPINEVKSALKDLYSVKLLRKPFLGVVFVPSSSDTASYLKNPAPGGYYVARVFKDSLLEKAGVQEGDMLYEINGFRVDRFGDIHVNWSEDKVSIIELLNRFNVGDNLNFVIYRNGVQKSFNFELKMATIPTIRQIYPEFEKIDYEIIGGMVVMQITLNHVAILLERAPHLLKYRKHEKLFEPALIITHIFANSEAFKAKTLTPGAIINEVNDKPVKTLEDFRAAIKTPSNPNYLTFRIQDSVVDGMLVALPLDKILKDEDKLAMRYLFPKSKLVDELQVIYGKESEKTTKK